MATEKYFRLIRPSIITGVGEAKRMSHDRVVDRLSDLEFITRNIESNEKPPKFRIELQIIDEELLYQMLAGKANRFLLAAILTKSRSLQAQPENVSWQVVENYYSAYYSVHYLMRMTGRSITSLDASAVKAIINNFLSNDSYPPIPEGLYELTYNSISKTLTLVKQPKGGGSHKDAWAMWVLLLEAMIKTSEDDLTEYASEFLDLTTHKKFILKSKGRYRPAEIRGEINYQFKGDCWQFEKKSSKKITILQRQITDNSTFINEDVDTSALLRNNNFIYSQAVYAFKLMASNYPRSIARSIQNIYSAML